MKREEAEFDRMFPSLSSYPLFNSAPYGNTAAVSTERIDLGKEPTVVFRLN